MEGKGAQVTAEGSWLARMMARKPRMLVVVALANKMARIVWAMTIRQEDYRNPAAVSSDGRRASPVM